VSTLSAVAEPDEWEKERQAIIRDMIRHEDALRDHRLSYLLTLNGFLFAALAFAWRENDGESIPLVCLLAAVGFVVGLSAYAGQMTSNQAVTKLRDLAHDPDPPVLGLTSAEQDQYSVSRWNKALVPWNVLPKLLIVIWPSIAVARIVTALVSWLASEL